MPLRDAQYAPTRRRICLGKGPTPLALDADRTSGPNLVGALGELSALKPALTSGLEPVDLTPKGVLGELGQGEPVGRPGEGHDRVAGLVHEGAGKVERGSHLNRRLLAEVADLDLTLLRHCSRG